MNKKSQIEPMRENNRMNKIRSMIEKRKRSNTANSKNDQAKNAIDFMNFEIFIVEEESKNNS